MEHIRILGGCSWTVRQEQETGHHYVATRGNLRMAASGRSLPELRGIIAGSLHLLVKDAWREGHMQQLLDRHGWALTRASPADSDEVRFEIPFDVVRAD
jgi:hypothetical protein